MKIKYIITCFFITFLMCHITVTSQNDTIFYDQKWKKTIKSKAFFYRPLPLQKKGDKSLIKDYYIAGGLQFEGWSKTAGLDDFYVGKVVWFYQNGNKKYEVNYVNGTVNGSEITYYKNGKIKKERQILNKEIAHSKSYNQEGELQNTIIYKEGYPFKGVSDCFIRYENGKRIGKTLYYENTNIPAFTKECSEEGCYKWSKETHYNVDGVIIQENKTIKKQIKEGREIEYYKSKLCGYIKAIKSIKTYKEGVLNGLFVRYDLNKEVLYKGIYKDSQPLDGTFENSDLGLTFISEYKNGRKNGKEIVVNKEKEIAVGIYLEGKRQTGTFVEERQSLSVYIINLISGIEEGKQIHYNVARAITMGYYHSEKGIKHGDYAVYDYEGNLIANATYKNGKPFQGTVITNSKPRFYENGERLRENVHVDIGEKERMTAFSKGSDKIEGSYNMGGFEMAASIVFLDTNDFLYSLSVGSLDLVIYGAYHLKNGKLKLKVAEEQKQHYVVYGRKDPDIKDSIHIKTYNYRARTSPLIQLNKQWYDLGDLKQPEGRARRHSGDGLFKIAFNKLSSMKIGINKGQGNNSTIVLKGTLKAESVNDFNDFIIAYNMSNVEITEFEKSTFTVKKGDIINGEKKKIIKEEVRENILDYIIENKSFPYYIRNYTFQKIKCHSIHRTEKIHKYIQIEKSKESL
ncbi:MAG: hypothetical protein JKY08_06885 [Flavobacteriaceae bacterium]|nr:hypothetical protein [Flavobacteriaceae bacterium]